ncbi:MAG: FAD-dependent monooxygenase, partial [Ramlibacter sp.]
AGLASVRVALGEAVTGLVQDAAGATLSLRDDTGQRREVRAKYVIGCDGASSAVRDLAGIALEDLGFDQPWLVVDVLANAQGLAKLPAVSLQYCEPQRPTTYLVGPKNHRRWEMSLHDDEDPQQMATPEATWKLLARWITPQDGQLWRQAAYRFHALVASRWRNGRVFVAGDAAHQQPPFLGQGMCQGIRDVANLGWKLRDVLRGRAADALLGTYGAERKAHVTELTTRIKNIGQLVGQRDPDKARARDAQLLAECGGVVKSMPRQNVQPPLVAGLLADGGLRGHGAVGTIFPQPWMMQGGTRQRFDELAGRGWRLVLAPGAVMVTAPFGEAAQALDLSTVQIDAPPWPETEGVAARWFDQQECVAALVRPDHYVFGVAAKMNDIALLLASAARQLQPEAALTA